MVCWHNVISYEQPMNYLLKKEGGGTQTTGYFSFYSGYIPKSATEDVYSRTLVSCSDTLESASCPSVAPPTSVQWMLVLGISSVM